MKKSKLFLSMLLAVLLWGGCFDLRVGIEGGSSGDVVRIPLIVNEIPDCDTLFSIQGTVCFSNPQAFSFFGANPYNDDLWDFSYHAQTHSFSLVVKPEYFATGVPIESGDTLFYISLQLFGEIGDFSSISVCDNPLIRQVVCLNKGTPEIKGYSVRSGRVEIQDSVFIAGMVRSIPSLNEGISDVKVQLYSSYNQLVDTTDGNGDYSYEMTISGHYWHYLQRNEPSGRAVSTFEELALAWHLADIIHLPPLYILAADVDCNDVLDENDQDLLHSVVMNIQDTFGYCPQWVFVKENITFADPLNPFPEFHDRNVLITEDQPNLDWIGIEKGRFPGLFNLEENNPEVVLLTKTIRNNKETIVRFYLKDDLPLSGFQLELGYDSEELNYTEFSSDQLDLQNFRSVEKGRNKLLINWLDPIRTGKRFSSSAPLFELTFSGVYSSQKDKPPVHLDYITLSPEAFDTQLKRRRIVLKETEPIHVSNAFSRRELENELVLYQNVPNPFHWETDISFELPSDEPVELIIFDSDGRLVKNFSGPFEKGINRVNLNGAGLTPGVYFCRLRSGEENRQIKLVYHSRP